MFVYLCGYFAPTPHLSVSEFRNLLEFYLYNDVQKPWPVMVPEAGFLFLHYDLLNKALAALQP